MTTGQLFLHSWRHFLGLHLSSLTIAIRVSRSAISSSAAAEGRAPRRKGWWSRKRSGGGGKEREGYSFGSVADTCARRRGLDQTLGSGPVLVLMPGRPGATGPGFVYSSDSPILFSCFPFFLSLFSLLFPLSFFMVYFSLSVEEQNSSLEPCKKKRSSLGGLRR